MASNDKSVCQWLNLQATTMFVNNMFFKDEAIKKQFFYTGSLD